MDLEVPFLSLFSDKPIEQRDTKGVKTAGGWPILPLSRQRNITSKEEKMSDVVPFHALSFWQKALDVKARQALDPKNWKPAASKLFKHWTLPPVNAQFLVSTNGSAISRAQANLRHNYCREKVRSSSEFYNPVRYQIHYTDLYNLKWKNNDNIIGIIPYFIKTKSYILLTPTWGASLYE